MELTVENQGVSPMVRNAEKISRRENLAGDTVRGDLDRTRMRILRQLSPHRTVRPHLLCLRKLDLANMISSSRNCDLSIVSRSCTGDSSANNFVL